MYSMGQALSSLDGLLPGYEQCIAGIPYEGKGVLYSEVFFIRAVLTVPPARLFESGRARGQSTLLLARAFPDTRIVSIEYHRDSPDVAVAEARLKNEKNVTLEYGDACDILPQACTSKDLVFIDGPKSFTALGLAFRLLREIGIPAVFVHDVYRGSAIRAFLEKRYPAAFYSDHPVFVDKTRHLDANVHKPGFPNDDSDEADAPMPAPSAPAHAAPRSYGATMACLPLVSGFAYPRLARRLALARLLHRWKKSLRKRVPART